MKKAWTKLKAINSKLQEDHVSAYAAKAAFFLMLSLVPIIFLLMTLVRYTPLTQADVMTAIYNIFPRTISFTMIALVDEVYNQTGTTISITILVALWSAGRGISAISQGLNAIRGLEETRNYFLLRLRSAMYTGIFLLVVIASLTFLGFGGKISFLAVVILVVISIGVYRFLPDEKEDVKHMFPGAIFTALGWTLSSFLISNYMDIFQGFSNLYGSLATIILIMLWLYFCMYVLLLGGEINEMAEEYLDNSRKHE